MDHLLSLPAGFELGNYKIQRVLGHGGFGITYLAHDDALKTDVAIKEYFPADLATRADDTTVAPKSKTDEEFYEKGLEYFAREARTVAAYNHPNIIAVKHYFEDNGTGYMVMPYERGESLAEILLEHGRLDEDEVIEILVPLLDALDTVHRAGYLHRDIKPGNIYIREDGSPVLIDFGAARVAVGQKSKSLTSFVTEGYAPLELYYTGEDQGPWTDIYQMGATFYRALFGEKPPEAPSRVRNDRLQWAVKRGEGKYSLTLLRGIDAALEVDPDDRPQSVGQWRHMLDLDEAGAGRTVTGGRAAAADPGATIVRRDEEPTGAHKRASAKDSTAATARGEGLLAARARGEVPSQKKSGAGNRRVLVMSSVAAVLLLVAGGGTYLAMDQGLFRSGPAPLHDCDRLAADRWDPARVGEGVARLRSADAAGAVSACRAALNEYPDEVRFQAQLARALRVAGNHAEAATLAQTAADAQHTLGMRIYGRLMMDGRGVAQDQQGGYAMILAAANAGNVTAQYDIGRALHGGDGVAADKAAAAEWYRRAADAGHSLAQFAYGDALHRGEGVPQDIATAVRYFTLSAEQGYASAQVKLSYLYFRGEGVAKDYEASVMWARRAADQGDKIGQYNLGVLYHNGQGVEKDYDQAREWFVRSANQEYANAHHMLGEMAEHGRGQDASPVEALYRYTLAARFGSSDAEEAVRRLTRSVNLAQRLVAERKAQTWRRP